jgi:hypothetical protein
MSKWVSSEETTPNLRIGYAIGMKNCALNRDLQWVDDDFQTFGNSGDWALRGPAVRPEAGPRFAVH